MKKLKKIGFLYSTTTIVDEGFKDWACGFAGWKPYRYKIFLSITNAGIFLVFDQVQDILVFFILCKKIQYFVVNLELQRLWTRKEWRQKVDEFIIFFRGFVEEGLLKPENKALCVGVKEGKQVVALREIGVSYIVGIDPIPSPPLVMEGDFHNYHLKIIRFIVYFDVFDSPTKFAEEIPCMLNP